MPGEEGHSYVFGPCPAFGCCGLSGFPMMGFSTDGGVVWRGRLGRSFDVCTLHLEVGRSYECGTSKIGMQLCSVRQYIRNSRFGHGFDTL